MLLAPPPVSMAPAPTEELTLTTARSVRMALAISSWRARMAAKEMSGAASVSPMMIPVSWVGKKPFGMTMKRTTFPAVTATTSPSTSLRCRSDHASVVS